jgi:ubiquinone/menaquinone biosynthesis C-methylase UbiE
MGFYADKLFPWLLDHSDSEEMAEQRRSLLHAVKGAILEIGMGTGANLPYYPENIKRLTAVEPSKGMNSRAKQRAAACGRSVEWHPVPGEQLPFEDGRFDSVVTVEVLCSVNDIDAVLREAYRVLKPGGSYHFLEHGLAQEESIRKWQYRLNGLSKIQGCGCELTRDIEKHIRMSSFIISELAYVSPSSGLNALLYPHTRGIANKPE